jgi:hypothetical protein
MLVRGSYVSGKEEAQFLVYEKYPINRVLARSRSSCNDLGVCDRDLNTNGKYSGCHTPGSPWPPKTGFSHFLVIQILITLTQIMLIWFRRSAM